MPRSREEPVELSDVEVLALSRTSPEHFAILVTRYEAPLMRRARAILRSDEEAEEAVQDAFTRIYLYADRYQAQEGATFSSWAYATGRPSIALFNACAARLPIQRLPIKLCSVLL